MTNRIPECAAMLSSTVSLTYRKRADQTVEFFGMLRQGVENWRLRNEAAKRKVCGWLVTELVTDVSRALRRVRHLALDQRWPVARRPT